MIRLANRPLPRSRSVLSLLAGLALLAGCGQTEVVSVDGSSTVFQISAAIAERLSEQNPAINVVVSKSGTGGGFKKFAAGEIDICDASREITADEAAACKAAGVDYIVLQVAFDGLAIVVNPANTWCDTITTEQLKTIWRKESPGAIEKWSDVNPDWPDEQLKLYGPGHDSGTFDYFNEVILGAKDCRTDYSPSEDDNALVRGVAGDKGSLGYFGYGYYAENRDKLKLLAVDSGDGPKLPTPENVRDGSYKPLARPLFIYVRKSSLDNEQVAEFVKYYLDTVHDIAAKVGYVPVTDETAKRGQETLRAALAAKAGDAG